MSQPSPSLRITPFSIQVEEEVLTDLRARIHKTRWPDQFDWRSHEREMNTFHHFRAELEGVHIHFVHERAVGGQGIPLILTHGWPSTFVEMLPLVPFLTD